MRAPVGIALLIAGLLAGCAREDTAPPAEPSTLVSVATSTTEDVPVRLRALGRVQSRVAPEVAAEVDGRILRLAVDEGDTVRTGEVIAELDRTALELERHAAEAEAARIEALLANAERGVKRVAELHGKGFVAREPLDDAEAERAVLQAQSRTAAARRSIVEDQLARTVIRAPLDARIERRLVSAGDFVRRGTPLVELATSGELRALLPFPEQQAAMLAAGQAVTLRSPLDAGHTVNGTLSELRPAVGEASRAVWAIVDIANPGTWRPGATVNGEIVVAVHRGAVVVPAPAIVRRPAGEVVYVIEGSRAIQRVVQPGERLNGHVEVREGLRGGERIALDGAAYLSDGASVRIAEQTP
jgi:RND family efflux transporter MFP subunit